MRGPCGAPVTSSSPSRSARRSRCARFRSSRRAASTSSTRATRRWRPSCRSSRSRPTSCSATSRTPSPPTRRSPRATGSCGSAARSTSATRRSGRASTASTARGASTTSRTLVGAIGNRLEVVMIPKVEGPWDIHYVDRLLAQLEAKHERASGRSSCTPSSRPRWASPTSRRSAPPARACRASASAPPTSPRRGA